MTLRTYGKAPYRIAVVHAGPGCIGSGAGLARDLSQRYGVMEPLQTKDTIDKVVEQLRSQISHKSKEPVILVAHAWGAWISAILAAQSPELVKKLILIGTLPLRDSYQEEVELKREYYFTEEQKHQYYWIKQKLNDPKEKDKSEVFVKYSRLCQLSDEYQPFNNEFDITDLIKLDGNLYYKLYHEALKLRKTGKLLEYFKLIQCPLCIMHGQYDAHPLEGVIEPLLECEIPHRLSVIDDCGHTPWREKLAYEDFFRAIFYEIELSE